MELNTNLIIQYTLVGIVLLGVTVWAVWKIINIRKEGTQSACSCCAINRNCAKKGVTQKLNEMRQ